MKKPPAAAHTTNALADQLIYVIRGRRVMLDSDLAQLYGVETKRLQEARRRNNERFPPDFVFQLSNQEVSILRSQIATSRLEVSGTLKDFVGRSDDSLQSPPLREHGGRRRNPFAFTEQGVAMLSGVLNSPQAVAVNIEIMRAFIRFHRILAENQELAKRLDALESKYDGQFKTVFDAIRELMRPPNISKRKIGF